jgi:hypothetical protein
MQGRFGGPPNIPPNPAGADAANANGGSFIDRLTQEDRSDDWELKVELVVVIDPPPAQPTP